MDFNEVKAFEAGLATAPAPVVAAAAFAALVRLGELGASGSLAFQEQLRAAASNSDLLEKALTGIDCLT